MGMFALISEVPFNLALTGQLLDQRYQNVYFTLFLGRAALCVFGFLGRFKGEKRLSRPVGILLMAGGVLFPGFYLVSLVNSLVVVKSEAVTILLYGIFCGGAGGDLLPVRQKQGSRQCPGALRRHDRSDCADAFG